MTDLAHDASGPASSEPADIAKREAGWLASSDKAKLRVFISYSRDDLDFADQLTAALDFSGFECFIDREGISGGEDWKRSLGGLICEAETPTPLHAAKILQALAKIVKWGGWGLFWRNARQYEAHCASCALSQSISCLQTRQQSSG